MCLSKAQLHFRHTFISLSSCRNNVNDALTKMQECLDRAAESIIPAKPDPEKAKEMNKRYYCFRTCILIIERLLSYVRTELTASP